MLILALDTATRGGSLALLDGDALHAAAGDPSRTHGERLPGEILDLVAAHGHGVHDIDLFAVVSGPGSFTGLRVGMATIQGLAMTTGKRVIAVPTLDAIASGWLDDAGPHAGVIAPILDGQRGDVYFAAYGSDGARALDECVSLIQPRVARPAVAAADLASAAAGRPLTLVRLGPIEAADDAFTAAVPEVVLVSLATPLAGAAARLAARRVDRASLPHALRPVYVRAPDAELARERTRASASAVLVAPKPMDTPQFVIAEASGADDLRAVEALQRRSFTNAWGAESIRWELENTDVARLYVMRAPDGTLVAYCACWLLFDELHINSLAVDEAWRRQGVAQQLLRRVIRDAVASGGRAATLEVRQSNEPARALYGALGFVVEAVRRDYYQDPREDALVLWNRKLDKVPTSAVGDR